MDEDASNKRAAIDPESTRRARRLRRETTIPERRLWNALRGHRLIGLKFRRQVVFGPYIVDFFNHAAKMVIELDGDSHTDRGAYDQQRQAWLEAQGLRVVRFSNDDVLKELENVLDAIIRLVNQQKPER